MTNLFNKAAHFGVGFGIGLFAHKPAAKIAALMFLGYQGVEAYRKGDDGYPEIKEASFGFGLGLAARQVIPWAAARWDYPGLDDFAEVVSSEDEYRNVNSRLDAQHELYRQHMLHQHPRD